MGGWAIWGHSKGFSAASPALPWLCVCRVIVLLNGEPSPHFDVQCSLRQVFCQSCLFILASSASPQHDVASTMLNCRDGIT